MRNINNSNNRINVDSRNYSTIARFRQEDDATLVLNLFKDGTEFDVSNQNITLRALRADGQSVNQTDNITKNKNIVTINLRRNILDVIGRCSIQLNISDSSGQFTTSEFPIEIERNNLGSDALKGSDNVQALHQILIDFKAEKSSLIKNITDDYNSLKKIIIDQNQAANLQNQINLNKQQSVENTTRIEQLEDLTPVWQQYEGVGHVTVNDSFDGFTKDLVIRGRTLNNLLNPTEARIVGWNLEGDTFTAISNGTGFATINYSNLPLKSNTIYTAILYIEENTLQGQGSLVVFGAKEFGSQVNIPYNSQGVIAVTATSNTLTDFYFGFYKQTITSGTIKLKIILLEGDYTNSPPSTYFDSITSVGEQEGNKIKIKSVGKNLIDWKSILGGELIDGYFTNKGKRFDKAIPVPDKNKQYTLVASGLIDTFGADSNFMKAFCITIYYTDNTTTQKYIETNNISITSLANKTIESIKIEHPFGSSKPEYTARIKDIALYEGSVATNYEQYKAKLIEIPLPFAKGLKSTLDNSVYDEINGNTGEIIQRVSDEYTALAKPIIHKITDVQLNTFDTTTHITQENNILSDISFKAKVSLSSQTKRLTEENKTLKEENRELREDANVIVDSLISFFGPMLLPADDVGGDQKILLEKLYEIRNR